MSVVASEKSLTDLYEGREAEVAVGSVSATPVDQSERNDYGGDITVIFAAGGKFYRATGYYSSYDGYTWDGGIKEVQKVTKTVEVFE